MNENAGAENENKINAGIRNKDFKLISKSNKMVKFQHRVISFFVTTKKAKVILSRQFTTMTKREMFEHCSLFSRNLEKENNINKNNFEISISEYENNKNDINGYRYTYQTLHSKNLYLVLVSINSFNFFETVEISKLIHRGITDICSLSMIVLDDQSGEAEVVKAIKNNALDIILAVDDMVNPVNGKDEFNYTKVKLNLKMDSEHEKEFSILQREKEDKQKENMVKGMEEIEQLKRENRYVDNSISSEYVENRNNIVNSIMNSLNSMNQNVVTIRTSSTGLNLKDRFIQRIIQQREAEIQMGKN
jgi:hypothetical protein